MSDYARGILDERDKVWLPIGDAPKDGTWVIAIRPKANFGRWSRVEVVQWSDNYGAWIWADHFDVFEDDMEERDDAGFFAHDPFECVEFTHWIPLPKPPITNPDSAPTPPE